MATGLQKTIRFLAILTPLLVTFGTYAVFCTIPGVGDLNTERLWFYLLLALGLVYAVRSRSAVLHFGGAGRYLVFFWVLLLYALLSLLWVENRAESLSGSFLYLLTGVFIVTLIPAVVGKTAQLQALLRILTACYIAAAALAIFEMFTGIYLFTQNPNAHLYLNVYGLHFPYATFYNMNDYASFIVLSTPFVAFEIVEDLKGPAGKLAASAVSLAGIFTVFNANARICYFALLVFAAAFAVALGCARGLGRIRRELLFGAVIFALLFSALLLSSVIPLNGFTAEMSSINSHDHSIVERGQLTAAGIRMLWDSGGFGVGVGNSVPLMALYSRYGAINLHNMPLQIAVEYGIIVFALYFLMLVFLGLRLFRAALDVTCGTKERLLACICFGSLCSFQLTDFASSDTMHVTVMWVFIAIWLAAVKLTGRKARNPI